MPTFPVQLPDVCYENNVASPVVESASRVACIARARYTPKDYAYETVTRLQDGKWSVETSTNGRQLISEHYPVARGHEIGLVVINWWISTYCPEAVAPVPQEVAIARGTWLTRATHKLLTEVGEHPEQLGALQILASNYGLAFTAIAGAPTLKGANWASAAHRNLERDIPEAHRRRAVALLVEIITGSREMSLAGQPANVAT